MGVPEVYKTLVEAAGIQLSLATCTMMSRVVLVVVVMVTFACLPPSSLARHRTLEPPPHEHPPALLHPLPASDGADSVQTPTPASEGNSQGSVAIATPVSQVTQPPPGTGRAKRGLYDYGTPWERRVYGRRQMQNRRRGWRRNRAHRYPYGRRRQHHNYRGPDYGDSFHESSHKYNNAGFVDTSGIDSSSSSSTVSFAQAKASGVLRTSTTGGDAEESA